MAKSGRDAYANVAWQLVTLSAANTLTFSQISFGVGLFEGRALVLHRVHWHPVASTIQELAAAADQLEIAITTSNRLSSIVDISDPAVIAVKRVMGAGVNVEPWQLPWISDYTMLPGGGKLLPANPIWVGCRTAGFAAAANVRVQLEFTFVDLSPQDYLEVIQSMFPANII